MSNFTQTLELFRKPAGYLIGKALVRGFGSVRDRERWGCRCIALIMPMACCAPPMWPASPGVPT